MLIAWKYHKTISFNDQSKSNLCLNYCQILPNTNSRA
uniref:Uncharacterized protein n=1 Tax=Lotus japonicus TaxID=34305 RepID=I3SI62_LOTJA|nr:unknown [Lotus japonicus]